MSMQGVRGSKKAKKLVNVIKECPPRPKVQGRGLILAIGAKPSPSKDPLLLKIHGCPLPLIGIY